MNKFPNTWGWEYSNVTSVTAVLGTGSIATGSANAKGAWTILASAGQIIADIWEFDLLLSNGHHNTAGKNIMVDIGVDNAGGTSYTSVISGLICGGAGLVSDGGYQYRFPLGISSGSTIAIRKQSSYASSTPPMACAFFARGKPSRPEMVMRGAYAVNINSSTVMVSSTIATSIVPGSTGSWGSWVLIGRAPKPLWWLQFGIQTRDAATAIATMMCEISAGNSGGTQMLKTGIVFYHTGTAERNCLLRHDIPCMVSSGELLWARASVPGTAETLYDCSLYGVGG